MGKLNQSKALGIKAKAIKRSVEAEISTAQAKIIWFLTACAAFVFGIVLALILTEFMSKANPGQMIMISAFLASFISCVLAEEQRKRIQFSIYGFLGGSGIGIFAALITNNKELLISGFAGSASGAFAGWFVSLLFCIWVYKFETGRVVLTYLSSGFDELRQDIKLNGRLKNEIRQVDVVRSFNQKLARRIEKQLAEILLIQKPADRNRITRLMISEWLASSVYALDFLYKLAKDSSYDYRYRVTLILFTKKKGKVEGRHWVYECGEQRRYNLNQRFDEESIAFKVLKEEIASPTFYTIDKSMSFIVFKITDVAVLSVDWLNHFEEDHNHVMAARSLFENEICPSIKKLLGYWDVGI